jgi:hypothetical protein
MLADPWAPAPELGVVDRREAFAARFAAALGTHAVAADARRTARGWLRLPEAAPASSAHEPPAPHATPAAPRPILIVPGMFGECVAPWTTPFSDAHALLRARGHAVHVLDVEGRSSSARNGRAIDAWMRAHAADIDGAVVIAYSKGATDFMHAAVLDADGFGWRHRLGALVTVSGVINGTPLASDWAERVETLLDGIDVPSCGAGDGGGVDSQTYASAGAARAAYLALAQRPPSYAVVAITDEPSVNPLLEAFHEHLSERDPRNDGQVLVEDALLPGSQLLAVAHADHWSIALPFESSALPMRVLGRNNHFPRTALLVAILDFLAAPPGQSR